jgi:hypothetical protein
MIWQTLVEQFVWLLTNSKKLELLKFTPFLPMEFFQDPRCNGERLILKVFLEII